MRNPTARSKRDLGDLGDSQISAPLRTNLGSRASSFVGRVRDRENIARLYEEGARLVTVLGLGGIGKTRVAMRFAEEAAPQFSTPGAGGVWLCDLADARTPARAAGIIASVLGIRLSTTSDEITIARDLGRAIASRKSILLVLDNFEQLASHAEATLGEWLRADPRARFLVTSRVALGVAGEHRWPLQPLELPNATHSTTASLRTVEAVELFVRRARQIDPELEIDDPTLLSIAEIVTRVEGIPLAIELAAARLGVLSVTQLAERTRVSLDVLEKSGETGRHASMRRAILDSYEALGLEEQSGLVGCAIFAGSFSLSAAEAILGSPDRSFLPALEKLRAHSLVRVHRQKGGDPRFSLYEPIREFAFERLQSDTPRRSSVARAHARHYAGVAAGYTASSSHKRDPRLAASLRAELDNLLSGHEHALETATFEGVSWALSITLAIEAMLGARGLFQAQLEVADRTLSGVDAAMRAPSSEWAACYLARGRANRDLGRLKQARSDFESALSIGSDSRSPGPQALAHLGIGELVETEGETAEALRRFAIAETLVLQMPSNGEARLVRAELFARTAHALRRENALSEAEIQIDRAIAEYRTEDEREPLARALYEAAVIALFRERHEDALRRFEEALTIAKSEGARYVESVTLSGLGILHQERGELDQALARHWEAVEIAREIGTQYREVSALYYLAGTYLERSQPSDAERILAQALVLVRSVGAPRYEALLEGCNAVVLAQRGGHVASIAAIDRAWRAAGACATELPLQCAMKIHSLHARALAGPKEQVANALEEARALVGARANDDPRFALRCLEASAVEREGPRAVPLVVRSGGRAFRLPGAATDVDLTKRKPLARIIDALARKRVESPGDGLALDELLAAGWPGERVAAEAGANRVYVALTTLRKMGLRACIVSGTAGYALDSTLPCELEETNATPI